MQNWSKGRKFLNFTIICFYALMVFSLLGVGPTIWLDYNTLYGISYDSLNASYAAQAAGVGIGSVPFIPIALKYGRRPVYLASVLITFLSSIWLALSTDIANIIAANFIAGLAGAVSEAIVQMTVCVHGS
jgi:MFS family permease